jgi:ParB-like chromosome segregation protein Spo0J
MEVKQKIEGVIKRVPIDQIEPNPWNPKEKIEDSKVNKNHFQAIKEGIDTWGMFEAIIVRTIEPNKKYQIVDGFHRWKDQSERGVTDILINDIGVISDDVAKKLTLLREKARVPLDLILTSKLLKDLASTTINIDDLAKEIGFSKDKLKEELEVANFDWNQYQHGAVEVTNPKKYGPATIPEII